MKKYFALSIWSLVVFQTAFNQIVLKEPLSKRQTYYKIDAILDTVSKVVTGDMYAYWVNKSEDLVPDIQMHMYLNGFSSINTTFYREAEWSPDKNGSEFGRIDISEVTGGDGRDLISRLHFIRPDDGNINDSTVLRILLHEPVEPGDTLVLKMKFKSKLPSRIFRTGYNDDFYFVAQWFPKFGVYESAGMRYSRIGGWNCHQFHHNSEFYSNHSVYDVTITLPENYVVGSGGKLLNETEAGNGNKTLKLRAEDIVDFAWTAWPGFLVFKDKWRDVDITLLLPPDRKNQAERQLKAVKYALEYFSENVGPYPWPHLTFIDPPSKGGGSGGMEYTTLFTSDSFAGVPDFLHVPEMVTVHEFGHAYFMGILATNEFEEPWLDEGVNQFWETRIMDNYYGKSSGIVDHPMLKISDRSYARASYVYSDSRQVTSNIEFSWNYPHGTYSMMSYGKTATCLLTLMGIVGEETTNEIFREYYKLWAFKHPSGRDFINVVNEVVGKNYGLKYGVDMNWFFDQTLYGTGICDYKVTQLYNNMIKDPALDNEAGEAGSKSATQNDSLYVSVVGVEREGEVMLPVEILVHFKDGKELLETWDGKSRFKDFLYSGEGKVEWVKIDPEYKIAMDVNYINNSMTIEPDYVPLDRMADKLIAFIQFLISAIIF
jgi:hypothetical protein